MFVVKPLMKAADLPAFLSPAAAHEYAEAGIFQDCGYEQSEIHFVDGEVTADEAVQAVWTFRDTGHRAPQDER